MSLHDCSLGGYIVGDSSSDKTVDISGVEFSSLTFLNRELSHLGFDSIFMSASENNKSSKSSSTTNDAICVNSRMLINNFIDLIQRYVKQLSLINRLEEQCHRLDKENELYIKRQQSLKDSNDISLREISALEEKQRQLQIKLNASNKIIKELNEEVDKKNFFFFFLNMSILKFYYRGRSFLLV
jgi:hypothetical protein